VIALRIAMFSFQDLIRNRWTIVYTAFFFILTDGLLRLTADTMRALVSMMQLVLFLIPLVSILFGTMYVYNSGQFVKLLLSQPVKRSSVILGQFFGLSSSLGLGFTVGVITPLSYHQLSVAHSFSSYVLLVVSGWLLTFTFVGLAFLVSTIVFDKGKGVALSLFTWLSAAVLYDGIILLLAHLFSEYPLERSLIGAALLNPIDLARILMMLKLDIGALLGYTGAVFERFFGSELGLILTISSLCCWAIIPLFIGIWRFRNKDL